MKWREKTKARSVVVLTLLVIAEGVSGRDENAIFYKSPPGESNSLVVGAAVNIEVKKLCGLVSGFLSLFEQNSSLTCEEIAYFSIGSGTFISVVRQTPVLFSLRKASPHLPTTSQTILVSLVRIGRNCRPDFRHPVSGQILSRTFLHHAECDRSNWIFTFRKARSVGGFSVQHDWA